jgi:hypothetical protein
MTVASKKSLRAFLSLSDVKQYTSVPCYNACTCEGDSAPQVRCPLRRVKGVGKNSRCSAHQPVGRFSFEPHVDFRQGEGDLAERSRIEGDFFSHFDRCLVPGDYGVVFRASMGDLVRAFAVDVMHARASGQAYVAVQLCVLVYCARFASCKRLRRIT